MLAISCSCNVQRPETDNGLPETPGEEGSGTPEGYRLVWQDLFNDGKLDETRWLVEINGNGSGNAELQYYRRENVAVVNEPESRKGCLRLTAKRESYGGRSFTSGRINTSDRYEFTHGKVEASIKLPETADGLWPAFWLLGANYDEVSWPMCGEIDILEMGNADGIKAGTQDRYFNGACHWGTWQNNYAWYPNYAKASTWNYSLQDGAFHLFTLFWDENAVKMYVDLDKYPDSGPYYEMAVVDKETEGLSSGYYFHHDYFILFLTLTA